MFLNDLQLAKLKVLGAIIGKDVKIDSTARIQNPETLEVGDHTTIDFCCYLSGKISLGAYNHLAPFVLIAGSDGFKTGFNVSISAHSEVYTHNADYSKGNNLHNPTITENFHGGYSGKVTLEDYVLCGVQTTILPNTILPEGLRSGKGCIFKGTDYKPYSLYYVNNDPIWHHYLNTQMPKLFREKLEVDNGL